MLIILNDSNRRKLDIKSIYGSHQKSVLKETYGMKVRMEFKTLPLIFLRY